MDLLSNPIRRYAWGSPTVIAAIQDRAAAGPEAELWMGAHPDSPSRLVRDGREWTLDALIAADPVRELGDRVTAEFGARLPFLMKLIASESPLSIQAHPDAEQARAGFEAENATGIAQNDPARNYKDPWHKPELIYAVTEFEGLCGFRPPSEVAGLLSELDAPLLREVLGQPGVGWLPEAFARLMHLTESDRAALVSETIEAAGHIALVAQLAEQFPGDFGIVVSLLLNHIRLAPGQALFLSAGVPHAYLRGVGIEAMASSDNVLRGGLTPKHQDAEELLRVLRFGAGPVPPVAPTEEAPGVLAWCPQVPDFALRRVQPEDAGGSVALSSPGPQVLFCLSGAVKAIDSDGVEDLGAGESAFVPAGRAVRIEGAGQVFAVTVGLLAQP